MAIVILSKPKLELELEHRIAQIVQLNLINYAWLNGKSYC